MCEPTTYSESFPKTITRKELERELKKHGIDSAELFEEHPELKHSKEFNSDFILGWLGY